MIIYAVATGILVGLMFHYIQNEPIRHIYFNVGLSLVGALLGYALSLMFPMLPEYREVATAFIITVISTHFMVLAWMVSRRRKPIVRHIDKTHQGSF